MGFKITLNELIHRRLIRLQEEAIVNLQGSAFLAAMNHLTGRLQSNPDEVGEIIFHLSQEEPVHSTVEGPLAMTFAIYELAQVVWIIRVDRLAAPHE